VEVVLSCFPAQQNSSKLYFRLAYAVGKLLSNDTITIFINTENNTHIIGNQLISAPMQPKLKCRSFGDEGYVSLHKVISQSFNHNASIINLTIVSTHPSAIGVDSVVGL
jgi:hypothetical protein